MSKQILNVLAIMAAVVVVVIVAGAGLMLAVYGLKAVWPDHFMDFKTSYCLEDKRIIEVGGIYEDNGKYEDESYKVKYDDGTVGLVDQAQLKTGKVCVKTVSYYDDDPRAKGLTEVWDY